MLFILLPIIGALIQQFFYGVTLTYPLLNLTALLAFLYLEKDSMLKDSLTKLQTRHQFESRLNFKLKRSEPFSVILIDLNGFKQINDNYGHDQGDNALIIVSSLLQANVKREDMVCRYGGDEFTLLIESTEKEAGKEIIRRISQATLIYNNKEVTPYKISMSFGAVYSDGTTTMEELLSLADERMYADKIEKRKTAERTK